MRRLDICIIAFLIAASFAAILRVGLPPRDPASGVAVIYAPGTSAEQTFARSVAAGARFVRYGGFDFIAIVIPETPDYVERALAAYEELVARYLDLRHFAPERLPEFVGAAEQRNDFLRRFWNPLEVAHHQIEGGEEIRVEFVVLVQERRAFGEAGAPFAAG